MVRFGIRGSERSSDIQTKLIEELIQECLTLASGMKSVKQVDHCVRHTAHSNYSHRHSSATAVRLHSPAVQNRRVLHLQMGFGRCRSRGQYSTFGPTTACRGQQLVQLSWLAGSVKKSRRLLSE